MKHGIVKRAMSLLGMASALLWSLPAMAQQGVGSGSPYESAPMQAFPPEVARVSLDGETIGLCVLGGVIISLLICLKFRSDMKTARIARDADEYLNGDSVNITGRNDRYSHTTETRRQIQTSQNGR